MTTNPAGQSRQPLRLEFASTPKGESEVARITDGSKVVVEMPLADFLMWDSYKTLEVAEQIGSVSIGYVKVSTLDFIRNLPHVQELTIRGVSTIDIRGISSLQSLTRLVIDGQVNGMEVLGDLTSLTSLYLSRWRQGADSIFRLKRLTDVVITKFPYTSFESCSSWEYLEELWINSGKLESVAGIPTSVRRLRLSNLPNFTSLTDLTNCRNLERLHIEICHRLQSLSGLERSHRLRVLSVSRTGRLQNLDPIRGLTSLEYLFLADGTTLEPAGVNAIYSLRQLQTLIINHTSQLDVERMKQVAPGCVVRVTPK